MRRSLAGPALEIRGSREPDTFKVMPVRIPVELLARIDQLREERSLRSRNEFPVQAVTAAVEQ